MVRAAVTRDWLAGVRDWLAFTRDWLAVTRDWFAELDVVAELDAVDTTEVEADAPGVVGADTAVDWLGETGLTEVIAGDTGLFSVLILLTDESTPLDSVDTLSTSASSWLLASIIV